VVSIAGAIQTLICGSIRACICRLYRTVQTFCVPPSVPGRSSVFASLVKDTVVIGTPHYSVDYCKSGYYASVVAVRVSDQRSLLHDYRGSTIAVNSTDSQSGFNSVRNLLINEELLGADNTRFFAKLCISGSHRQSIRWVAAGTADICAIDPVSWRLAQMHEPAANQLKVIAHTPYTPGLPLFSSADAIPQGISDEQWRQACLQAFKNAIDSSISNNLFISDINYIHRKNYEAVPIRDFAL